MGNYENVTDADINNQVAEADGSAVTLDYCNDHDAAYPIMERLGMVLVIDGTACIPSLKIKHKCEGRLLRAAMICFLKSADKK